MNRRKFLTSSVIATGGAILSRSLLAKTGAPSRPNVILCMTDDQGWGDTGYNGHPHLKTPNLDKMASEGVRFDRFYSAAPVCSPTRGSCITGRHPNRYGIWFAMDGHIKPQELTIYEALKARGYATGHFGKWHLGTLTREKGAQNRWGVWSRKPREHYSPPWVNGVEACFVTESKVPTWDPMKTPEHWKRKGNKEDKPFGNDYFVGPDKIARDNLEGDDSRVIMDRVVPFIKQAVAVKKSFLAVVWFHTPHSPVLAGPKHLAMYKDRPEHEAHYYGCLTAMDQQVGRLRKTLNELSVSEDTIMFFCSDNGPARQGKKRHVGSPGPFRGFKLSLLEGGIRVPGIMVWPRRIKQPRVVKTPACTSDYVPTIYEALNIKPKAQPTPLDGISLLGAVFRNETKRAKPIAFAVHGQIALIDNRYKIYSRNRGKTYSLYDLVDDPGEKKDLADKRPDILKSMKKTLESWRQSCDDSLQGKDYKTDGPSDTTNAAPAAKT
ncbi:MAG: sulfatase-like hydrolase/transferase [Phycisphaerae bacterium]|jgi:arylsulfatase A-like enzyme|nr:sulfatase-like hydrolase/transferase [Phycisphaerae bacterium]